MKLSFFSLFILLSILITSCNTSNKVVSSSFIQKRKYTRGYHFDFLAKNQKRTKSVSEKHPSLAKQIIPVPKKEIALVEDSPIPDRMKNLTGNIDLTASVDNGTVILSNQKMISDYENFIQQKDNSTDKTDNRELNDNAFIGFILSLGGLLFIFISQFVDLFQFGELGWIVLLIGLLAVLIGGVFGWIGRKEIKKDRTKYYGLLMANISIIISFIVIFSVLFYFFDLAFLEHGP